MVRASPLTFIPFFPSLSASITVLIYRVLLPPACTPWVSCQRYFYPLFPPPLSSVFFVLSFFLLRHHTLPFPPSLGMRGNLERCRLMTVETCVGHSGLVSGNTPGIQTRTSDILFLSLYVLMSHLLLSCFKSDESGTALKALTEIVEANKAS